MKNVSLFLNGLLIMAVGFLYYKAFSKKEEAQVPAVSRFAESSSIVYVNTDTLLKDYPYFQDMKKAFEQKQDSADRIISGKTKTLENEIKSYQGRAEGLTEEQRMAEEERLYKKQQDLVEYRKQLMNDLANEEEKLMDGLQKDLVNVLKEYNKSRNYEFILGFQKGSGILLASDSLDITKDVIRELNEEKK